jgi:hypothetical protein
MTYSVKEYQVGFVASGLSLDEAVTLMGERNGMVYDLVQMKIGEAPGIGKGMPDIPIYVWELHQKTAAPDDFFRRAGLQSAMKDKGAAWVEICGMWIDAGWHYPFYLREDV